MTPFSLVQGHADDSFPGSPAVTVRHTFVHLEFFPGLGLCIPRSGSISPLFERLRECRMKISVNPVSISSSSKTPRTAKHTNKCTAKWVSGRHSSQNNPLPLLIKGPSPSPKKYVLKYGSWEALDWCKILLRGVGRICPPGKHHSENFQTSIKIEKCKHLFEMFGFGTILY
jgi:hypothetical protein